MKRIFRIDLDEGEGWQASYLDHVFSKFTEENFPKLRKFDTQPFRYMKHTEYQSQDQKRNSPWHITVKTPNIHNKVWVLKDAREKKHVTYKGKPIRITWFLSANFKIQRSLEQMYCKFCKTTDANLHSCIQGLQTKRGLTGKQTPLNPVWIFPKGDPSQLGLKMVVFLAFLLAWVQRPTLFPWHIYQPSQGDLGPLGREAGS